MLLGVEFGTVILLIVLVVLPIAAVLFAGAFGLLEQLGQGGLSTEDRVPTPPLPPTSAAAKAEREEGNIGVSCVAAPVFGPLGDVVAALSVTGPSALVRADRIGPAVRLAAAAASRAYASRR